ncbi:MAG TPA: glucodextranase DOMON-like domain-containing protein [Azospirillaceae bacterium]|nr:glucodextranase DOMON-like domain-containing protein [Azospirillaceae bacterium]
MKKFAKVLAGALGATFLATAAQAAGVEFKDPTGDDNGPGKYTYPTDAAYLRGAFDLTGLKVVDDGGNLDFQVSVAANLNDPWGMGVGFATQLVFVFIDTDGKAGSGNTKGVPGLNVQFAPEDAWEKVVVLSPQKPARVGAEVRNNAADFQKDIIVPGRTKGTGKTISATVKKAEIADSDPSTWKYQVVVQSNEGFPAKGDLLSRRVNEFEGQHRFGGGNDGMCDPHVMDILAGKASGGADEVQAQHAALGAFECGDEGEAKKLATVPMVKK